MHRSLLSFGALALAAVVSSAARAQAPTRVSQQQSQEVGPPAPVEQAGTPRMTTTVVAKPERVSPMFSALNSAAKDIRASARAGQLVSPRTNAAIAAGASQAVVSLMTMPTAEAEKQVRNAFMLSGQAEESVSGMMVPLSHLLSDNDAGHVRDAQKHFDSFMRRSPSWYRDNPPAEVLAVEAIVQRMGVAVGSVRR